jgi:hypothetical protein
MLPKSKSSGLEALLNFCYRCFFTSDQPNAAPRIAISLEPPKAPGNLLRVCSLITNIPA